MTPEYKQWLKELKGRIQSAQIKAALKVNAELIALYWELGREILQKEKIASWGEGLIPRLSMDLLGTFPDMKGFSKRNLFISGNGSFFTARPQLCNKLLHNLRQPMSNQ